MSCWVDAHKLALLTGFGVIACGGDAFTPGGKATGGAAGAAGKPTLAGAAGMPSGGSVSHGGGGAGAGEPPAAGGPPLGGMPPMAGGPPQAGAPPLGGAGTGGMSNECSSGPDCQKCCDERFPDTHGPFANKFSACACDVCGDACQGSFCLDLYTWNDACLSCIREQISSGCSAPAVECNATPQCEDFATCSFSCL